jgi:hypothetical protein
MLDEMREILRYISALRSSTLLRILYFSRFRESLVLISLGAFLAFSSLGAGSSKRTRKPLGAHQEGF